jgi:hypothetical protein
MIPTQEEGLGETRSSGESEFQEPVDILTLAPEAQLRAFQLPVLNTNR